MMMLSRSWTLGSRKGSLRSVSPSEDHLVGGARVPSIDGDRAASAAGEEDRWSMMLPELMREIVRRVETSEKRWPPRSSVVSCACVCRRWRDITTSIVRSPSETGMITFPSSLKQPGPKGQPIQCFIKRNKRNSTFFLYLSLTQFPTDRGKFLLAARRIRHGAHTEYIISLDVDDISQGSNAYVGKLRSDFFGTKFTIYDVRPPFDGAKPLSCRSSRRISSKRISPQVPVANFEIGQVSYQFNLLKSRGPRRMLCTVQRPSQKSSTPGISEDKQGATLAPAPVVVLTNKAPRWHQHLQCWCLNFHGRVTVASVKNFQLVGPSELEAGDEDSVLLQFGKVGDDLFTMDYRQPLSAFQAFAICLSSFGTKFACE